MELRETRLENKRVREKNYNKGAMEYFGANLAHLLNLVQVTDAKISLPSRRPRRGLLSTSNSWCYSYPTRSYFGTATGCSSATCPG